MYGPPVPMVPSRLPGARTTACPACGGPVRRWGSVPSSELVIASERFALVRCLTCGTAVTVGELTPGLYEAGAYAPQTPRLHRLARPLLQLFDRQRLSLVRSLVAPPARLLDAGAGRGRFVAAARAAGYAASGIEPSARGSEAAAMLGLPVIRATIDDAVIGPSSLDIVTLWHVLEHLDDPGSALSRISTWLREDGGLPVGVPNLHSAQARIGGERWYHLDLPRHCVHFTPLGLHELLRARGFDVLDVRHTLLEHNPFGMWQSILSRLTSNPSYVYNLLKHNAPWRSPDLVIAAAALPLAPLAALGELAADAARRGGRSQCWPGELAERRGGPRGPEPLPRRSRTGAFAAALADRTTRWLPCETWKEVASAASSATRTTFIADSANSPNRCREPKSWRGPTTRSSWRST